MDSFCADGGKVIFRFATRGALAELPAMSTYQVPLFLQELLHARSPSGYEAEAQAVFDRHVKPAADAYTNDPLGNRIATVNPAGDPVLMLAGHLDELGLIITYVNADGFLYFDTIGGHDRIVISGRRVIMPVLIPAGDFATSATWPSPSKTL